MRAAGESVEVAATFESLGVEKAVTAGLQTIDITVPLPFQRTVLRHTVRDSVDILAEAQPQSGRLTALAVFAAHSVLRNSGRCAIVVCQSVTSCARMLAFLKKMNVDGLRPISCLDVSTSGRIGEQNQVAVCLLGSLEGASEKQLTKVSALLVEDVAAHDAKELGHAISTVANSSTSACMFFFTSKSPAETPMSIRYLLRRSHHRYFYSVENSTKYIFLMCHDQRDRSELNCRLNRLNGLGRVLIMTHNKEVRELRTLLQQRLTVPTYALQRNTPSSDKERILSDFLNESHGVLIAMDAYVGVDMMDVDVVIQYYPPQKSMGEEGWVELVWCLNRTGNPAAPTTVWTIVGPEDFSLAAYFMKQVGTNGPVLNVSPSHPRFGDIVRNPDQVLEEKLKLESGEWAPLSPGSVEATDGKIIPLPRSRQDDTFVGKGGSKTVSKVSPTASQQDKKKKVGGR